MEFILFRFSIVSVRNEQLLLVCFSSHRLESNLIPNSGNVVIVSYYMRLYCNPYSQVIKCDNVAYREGRIKGTVLIMPFAQHALNNVL